MEAKSGSCYPKKAVNGMKMKKGCMTTLVTITILIVIFFLVWLLSAPRYVSTKNSGGFPDLGNIDLKVKNYRWRREWRWSGIFPIYGEFMTDPHFGGTVPKTFTSDIQKVLNSNGARYQGVDINPWFYDENISRTFVAIEIENKVYEYDVDTLEGIYTGFTNTYDEIYAFFYKDSIYVYTELGGGKFVVIIIPLPIQDNIKAKTVYLDTDTGQNLLSDLSSNHNELSREFKQSLCNKSRSRHAYKMCDRIWGKGTAQSNE